MLMTERIENLIEREAQLVKVKKKHDSITPSVVNQDKILELYRERCSLDAEVLKEIRSINRVFKKNENLAAVLQNPDMAFYFLDEMKNYVKKEVRIYDKNETGPRVRFNELIIKKDDKRTFNKKFIELYKKKLSNSAEFKNLYDSFKDQFNSDYFIMGSGRYWVKSTITSTLVFSALVSAYTLQNKHLWEKTPDILDGVCGTLCVVGSILSLIAMYIGGREYLKQKSRHNQLFEDTNRYIGNVVKFKELKTKYTVK